MPHKPKKPCAFPGCPNLTDGRYCEAHASQANREYNRYRRDPGSNKVYGRLWKTIRALYLAKHPLCERCLKAGRTVPAEEVHHIVPVAEGGGHEESNLMALCKSCHSAITISSTNSRR